MPRPRLDPNDYRIDPRTSRNKTAWMEECQEAYLQALVVQSCLAHGKIKPDIIKLDYTLYHERINLPIGVQLKSTCQDVVKDGYVSYTMDGDLHEKLRVADSHPRFLFLLALPEEDEWIKNGKDWIEIHRSMYWLSVRGESRLEGGSKTYRIPKSQLVTPDWLLSVYVRCLEDQA